MQQSYGVTEESTRAFRAIVIAIITPLKPNDTPNRTTAIPMFNACPRYFVAIFEQWSDCSTGVSAGHARMFSTTWP